MLKVAGTGQKPTRRGIDKMPAKKKAAKKATKKAAPKKAAKKKK
jgi:hypothetical protein